MKKYIWISLLILFVFGCGSRKKSVLKETAKTESKSETSGKTETDIQSGSTSETDFSQFLLDNSLKITSDGNPYELQYGNLILKGSASIELTQKKENISQKTHSTEYVKLRTITTYQTKTQHNTETTYRTSNIERSGISFGNMIWIVIIAMIAGAVLWPLLKSCLPKWKLNIFK
ncbi:hypothetical protein U9K52_09790 [Chryseobacterium sp. MHB01]|uniref:hypothetical protein n=1 Tax=Chryseobacterium sp. MHB01 TaxID=3109433 RepID=UPI002B003353|nr:hypothetical protein [Chryseobacterium sp. MHB01]MEA1849203.1 hypothetical protein [Chryseobacterium sp. MHB01]